jgi:ribosomal protein S1
LLVLPRGPQGRRGLFLITDLADGPVSDPGDYAKAGDVLTAKVLRFNWENGDFVASLKALHAEPGPQPLC